MDDSVKNKWQGDVKKDFQKGFQKSAETPEWMKKTGEGMKNAMKRMADLIPSAGASDYQDKPKR